MTKYILGIIVLIGAYLRIPGILTNSFAFTYDVGRDMLKVSEIVELHKIPLIGQTTGLGGLFYGPWWYYILTPPFIVSGGNPQGVAFFMALCGLAVILLSFYLGKMVSGNRLGLIFAALVSFSSSTIGLSSQIWNPNIAPVFVLLVFILLEKLKKTKRKFTYLTVLGFLLGLLIDTEIVFGLLFSMGTVLYLIIFEKKKLLRLSSLGLFLGILITLLPRIFFEIRHNFIMTQTLLHPSSGSESFLNFSGIIFDVPERIMSIFAQFTDTVAQGNIILSLVILLGLILIFYARRHKLGKNVKQIMVVVVIILFTFVFGTSIFARAIWGHYLVALPILYILFLGIGFELMFEKSKKLTFIIFVTYCFWVINPIQQIKNAYQPIWEGNAAVYRNQTATLDYIYKEAQGRHFNYTAYTPVVHDFTYQYLFMWYGENKFDYKPSKNTEKLLYIIIEPDVENPSRIKDWLKIREGDGRVVKEEIVKGGIKVQTRTR